MSDNPLDLSSLWSGFTAGATGLVTGQTTDLKPRIQLHTPLGDTIIDPWAPGGTGIPGVTYEIVWGTPNIPPAAQLGPRLNTFLVFGAIGLGVLLLMK